MATLRADFALFLDAPPQAPEAHRGVTVELVELPSGLQAEPDDELFGPHAPAFSRTKHARGWRLSATQEAKGDAGAFFAIAHQLVTRAVAGRKGWVLDVLKLWPTPAERWADMPDEPLPEDVFSMAFHERGEHGYRAETIGLAKLGQKELSFAFHGEGLVEEAALLCAHFADWIFTQRRRVADGQAVAFGLDTLTFKSGDAETEGLRAWHPPMVRRLLPEDVFPGVGVLEVLSHPSLDGTVVDDVSVVLERARAQRELLEAHGLSGESPHHSHEARACACVGEAGPFRGTRVEPHAQRDSGWHFACAKGHELGEIAPVPLGTLARKLPALVPYLALPPGVVVTWHGDQVSVDGGRVSKSTSDGEDSDVSLV